MIDTRKIDLHVHSTFSDGTLTPEQLVTAALEAGLSAIAITDHDTTDGIAYATSAAKDYNLEIIPGVELSCEYKQKEIHMLGFYLDNTNPILRKHLKHFQQSRSTRNQEMVNLLAAEGLDITFEKLLADNPDCVITRANIARYLVDHGCVKDMATVFSKYIGDDCRCFVPREKVTPAQAIQLIHEAGGVAFLAHPLLYHMGTVTLNNLVSELALEGLDGMEAIYSTYQPGDERNMKNLANEYHLLISGGSDFHGANKPFIKLGTGMGHLFIPYEVLTPIKKAAVC
jgi:predicted metal-dependent phosphoesterase TrpH